VLGDQTARYGKKALIVTGKNSTKKTGLLDKAVSLLKKAGVESVLFDQVEQNPLTTTASRGAGIAKRYACDVVVGLGGGSIMDAAKGIAFMALNDGDISEYIFAKKSSECALPIILVPTTCGTGSEGNGFAVLSNPDTNDKKSLRCNAIIAKASIIDPELMTTMPKPVLASVGFDALCHNMEAYLSKICQPMTEILALEGIRLVGESVTKAYEDYGNMDAWEKLSWGSTLGGMVINAAGVTAAHGAEHPASGLRDIVHGRGLAALTPVIYEESISGSPEKFAKISRLLGGNDESDCVARINLLLSKLDLATKLGDQGIREEDIDWMAENCMKISAAGIANNPVVFGLEDVKRIYRKAL
jgi:alcohol dehydrogenase class IV